MKTRLLIPAAAAALLAACMPRLHAPEVTTPERFIHADSCVRERRDTLSDRWWELFGDPRLDSLVEYALANSPDLGAAAARVEQAQARLGVVRAQYLPQLGVGIDAGGDYNARTGIVQSYAVEPTLSWEISLFGAMRRSKQAAKAGIAASEWALHGVRLALAAEVATGYFTLLEAERNLAIAHETLRLRRESAALIDSMFRYGMSDGVALEQARSLVYTAESDLPQYRRAVEQTRLSLAALLGNPPGVLPEMGGGELRFARYPDEIPVGLPSELLERRPDIMQAYWSMKQAAAQAGVARSARFPSIALTAQGGVASASIHGLTGADPWAWSATGSIVAPVFSFGKLKRAEQLAVAQYDEAARNYEQTVYTAFSDVEKSLVAIETCREESLRCRELVAANTRIAVMARALYRSGISDYLDVIDAERNLYQSQTRLVGLVARQYLNYIALCKALGGGWQGGGLPPREETETVGLKSDPAEPPVRNT